MSWFCFYLTTHFICLFYLVAFHSIPPRPSTTILCSVYRATRCCRGMDGMATGRRLSKISSWSHVCTTKTHFRLKYSHDWFYWIAPFTLLGLAFDWFVDSPLAVAAAAKSSRRIPKRSTQITGPWFNCAMLFKAGLLFWFVADFTTWNCKSFVYCQCRRLV